jgi:hypothetical protein
MKKEVKKIRSVLLRFDETKLEHKRALNAIDSIRTITGENFNRIIIKAIVEYYKDSISDI